MVTIDNDRQQLIDVVNSAKYRITSSSQQVAFALFIIEFNQNNADKIIQNADVRIDGSTQIAIITESCLLKIREIHETGMKLCNYGKEEIAEAAKALLLHTNLT